MTPSLFDAVLALHRAGRFDEAEAGYRECLLAGEANAAFPLGVLLLQQARYSEAVEVLEPLAATAPDNADVAVNLSVALRHCKRNDEALLAATRACSLAPGQAPAWNARGLAALELGRLDEALAAFETGLRLAPGHLALELHRGHCLRRLGRAGEALPIFARVVQADPQLLEGWRGLAKVQSVLGQLQPALRSRQRALELAPHDREVVLEHAIALLWLGQVAEAAQRLAALAQGEAGDAQAWAWLGRARLKLGDLAGAREAFEQASAHDPADAEIAHTLASIRGELPEAVERNYIRHLFDDFADHFDHTLVQRLAYATPTKLAQFLRQHGADVADTVLDLGCGTGLMARELARPGRFIDGVDLSPRMLDFARAKGLYRDLHLAELIEFLDGTPARWELVVAADVFIYVADLQPVFAAVFERLAPGGCFAFSVECSARDGTEVLPTTGRFRHAPDRLARELATAGFVDVVREAVVLRFESGEPVAGELLLARRPPVA
jgi:predicted TPR repeat methyltransferase